MPMRCGECRTAVDETAEACPSCGAPRTKFREASLGDYSSEEHIRADPSRVAGRRQLGVAERAGIGIAVVVTLVAALAIYSKHSHLENIRHKCTATFDLTHRCDCIVAEISKNTYAISFVPMLRIVSGLSSQKLAEILRDAAMTCVEPR